MKSILERPWFLHLPREQQQMIELTIVLYEREYELQSTLLDYSFVIFPIAKAYEGFLKQYLFDLQLIDQRTFEGRKFRLGRALNPDIRENQKDEFWVYDDLAQLCGEDISRALWDAWLECRNRVFHYFPSKNVQLSLEAVGNKISLLDETITDAHYCKIEALSQDQGVMVRTITS